MDNGQQVGPTGLPEDSDDADPESDELYDKAVQVVVETRRASISAVALRASPTHVSGSATCWPCASYHVESYRPITPDGSIVAVASAARPFRLAS